MAIGAAPCRTAPLRISPSAGSSSLISLLIYDADTRVPLCFSLLSSIFHPPEIPSDELEATSRTVDNLESSQRHCVARILHSGATGSTSRTKSAKRSETCYHYVGPPPSRNGKRVSGNPVPKFAPRIPKRSGASCTKGSFCVIGENIVLLLLLLCAACKICDS